MGERGSRGMTSCAKAAAIITGVITHSINLLAYAHVCTQTQDKRKPPSCNWHREVQNVGMYINSVCYGH